MNITTIYRDEIGDELNELNKMELGADDYKATVSGVTQLTDRFIKLKELEIEQQKVDLESAKIAVEELKIEEGRKERRVNTGISVANIGVPALITIGGTILMFVFEERGTITTQAGRKFVDRIFRAK